MSAGDATANESVTLEWDIQVIEERFGFDSMVPWPSLARIIETARERDAAVKEMEARELHHFEAEEENARLRSIIAAALEEACVADQGDSFAPICDILSKASDQ